jgi:hypothetical protein
LLAPLRAGVVAWSDVAPAPSATPDAAAYLDAAWFRLPGGSAVFLLAAVLLAAGGSLLRPRGDVAYLLALPLSRRRWLITHVAMSLAALTALVVVVHVVLATGASRADASHGGGSLALGPLLARSLAVLAAASVWIGVTVGVLAVVRYPALAAGLVLAAVLALPTSRFRLDLLPLGVPGMLPAWDPWALADPRAWDTGVPVASLLVALALGIAGMLLALYRLERVEP